MHQGRSLLLVCTVLILSLFVLANAMTDISDSLLALQPLSSATSSDLPSTPLKPDVVLFQDELKDDDNLAFLVPLWCAFIKWDIQESVCSATCGLGTVSRSVSCLCDSKKVNTTWCAACLPRQVVPASSSCNLKKCLF